MDNDAGLTERERYEIKFARLYVKHFRHGTSGHLAHSLIAKLADMAGIPDDYHEPPVAVSGKPLLS